MSKAMIGLVIVILTPSLTGQFSVFSQTSVAVRRSGDLSAERVENVKIDKENISSFFSDLSFTYDIPIGLEIAANENASTRYSIELKNGTLAELLTLFFVQHPQYTWKMEDGVVNVFPKGGGRDQMLRDVLAVKIQRFRVEENTSCWNFVAALLDSPETKSILETNGTTYSRRSPSGFYIPQLGRKFTFAVSDLKVRAILNKVISRSPTAKFWVVTRNPDGTLFMNVSARHEDSLNTKGKRALDELFGEPKVP